MGYRASSQASTKHSPFYILYQEQMRLPIDVEIMPPTMHDNDHVQLEDEEDDLDEMMHTLLGKRKAMFGQVEENIVNAQEMQKECYDRKHLPEELPVGTQVLVENTRHKQRKGGKLEEAFKGPYIVHKSFGRGIYQIRSQDDKVLKQKVNIGRLKVFKKRKFEDNEKEKSGKKTKIDEQGEKNEEMLNGNNKKEEMVESRKQDESKRKEEKEGIKKKTARKEMVFTRTMRRKLIDGEWLEDNHIALAQEILKEQYPCLDGFQSPLLSQINGFRPVKGDQDSIQLHFISNNHWVTSAYINQEVVVYDSKYGGELSSTLTHQLEIIYKTMSEKQDDETTLYLHVPNVQQQAGINDCGLFAIAFAVHIARGDDVEDLEFDQSKMRDHVIKCF